MPAKRSQAHRIKALPVSRARRGRIIRNANRRLGRRSVLGVPVSQRKLRSRMPAKSTSSANEYLCAIEKTQNGKYNVRVRAAFGRGAWSLPVYFLASSFNGAMKKLEESLRILQKNEERLRFWTVEHSDDPAMAGDLLEESGLWFDRRKDYPHKYAEVELPRERTVPATVLAPLRRTLADSVAQERPATSALAGD
jgi:hypothetical protein